MPEPGSEELYERAEALAVLTGALKEVRAGQGRLVLLGGEAGVGKTALLRRFAAGAGPEGVLWGGCDPLFTPAPLGPFLDIADQLGGRFGELVKDGAAPPRLLHELLRELGGQGTAVMVIEDLHWADEASLDLLELSGRRIGQVPALVVGSFRDDEIGPAHPLRTVLGRLASAPVTRLRLEPLSRAAVAAMAPGHGADAGVLFEQTGGNPFFVTEVLSGGGSRVSPAASWRCSACSPRACRMPGSPHGWCCHNGRWNTTCPPSCASSASGPVGRRPESWAAPRRNLGSQPRSGPGAGRPSCWLMDTYAHPEALAETQWLADHLDNQELRVIEVDEDTSAYQRGHIPGAVGWNWSTDLHAPVGRDCLSQRALSALLSQAQAGDDRTVILYGGNNNWFAAYPDVRNYDGSWTEYGSLVCVPVELGG